MLRRFPVVLLALSIPAVTWAQPTVTGQAEASKRIALEVGQTQLIRLSQKIVRVSVADPEVTDVRVVTPLQVLVTAKGVGSTDLVLWGSDDKPLVVAVQVTRNLAQLRRQLGELFPGEKLQVSSAGDLVVLSGKVSDLRVPARAAEVAKLHSKRLANLVEVSGNQQVQLDVRFAEVSRTGLREIGLNFLWRDTNRQYVGAVRAKNPGQYYGRPPQAYLPGTFQNTSSPWSPTPVSTDAFNLLFSTGLSQFPFSAILSILAQQGLAKVLAEPTLVAMSGQEAQFHAGGEVPILLSQQLGQVSVRYKKFGVRLKFVPTVLGKRSMSLKIYAEVSELDNNAGVTLGGFQVPGFKTRSSDTTIRLKDGQSFAVAGLLSDSTRQTVRKVPLLGEIPILGSLFRSKSFQREETELLVVVKAHLVRPLDPDEAVPLPGEDELNDPDDFSFFLLSSIEGTKKKKKKETKETQPKGNKQGARPGRRKAHAIRGGPVGPVGFMRVQQ